MVLLKDKKVLVVGLGRSGIAAARFASERGARVTVTDTLTEDHLVKALDVLEGLDVDRKLGGHDIKIFEQADLVVVSPGVSTDMDGLKASREKGIPVIGEMELAVGEITKPIAAVTGTNGKTTTTALIGHLMSSCGISNCVGGNIGTPITSLVNKANAADWVVLEVSSFQLETTPSLTASIAVWLNATPDHLDRHRTFEEYVAAKARLFAPLNSESWGIYNAADKSVADAVAKSKATLISFDPSSPLLNGGWYDQGDLCINIESRGHHRFSLRNVPLEGVHNRENMLAAILSVFLAGGKPDSIQSGLESFKGLPHRLEFVSELGGVRFYNDSKGTNVGATLRALNAFSQPVVLIAGGQEKGTGFEQLAPAVREKVKRVVLIGEAADRIRRDLGDAADMITAGSMAEAVDLAWRSSEPGDVVLLSPACASFDMFVDYAHRGDMFKEAIKVIEDDGKETR